MKATLSIAALMAVAADAALIVRAPAAQAAPAGPYTLKNKAAAIAAVISAMDKKSHGAKAAARTSVKVAPTSAKASAKDSSKTSATPVRSSAPKRPSVTTARITGKGATVPTPKVTSAPTISRKVAGVKRADTTMPNWGSCGMGAPVTATYGCNSGWSCQAVNPYYYQCLTVTSSLTTATSSSRASSSSSTGSSSAASSSSSIPSSSSSMSSSSVSRSSSTSSATSAATTSASIASVSLASTSGSLSSVSISSIIAPSSSSGAAPTSSSTNPSAAVVATMTTSMSPSSSPSTTLATSTTTISLTPNDACGPQPNYGYTYAPQATAPAGWMADTNLNTAAVAALAPTGYTWSFAGLFASLQQSGYMGVTTLPSYSPALCSAQCNAMDGCKGFVLYYERTPSINPAPACPSPNAQTVVKCTFYSAAVDYRLATNIGEWRSDFAVVISGSNGYSKV